MSKEFLKKFGQALPDKEGMVRLSTEPPNDARSQLHLPFEHRFIEVPAADMGRSEDKLVSLTIQTAPVVIPQNQPFSPAEILCCFSAHRAARGA